MREIDAWQFFGFYGILYLMLMIVVVVCYPLAQLYAKPIAALVFPIAQNNSLLKNVIVITGMYWGMLLFYTLVIQRIRLKF